MCSDVSTHVIQLKLQTIYTAKTQMLMSLTPDLHVIHELRGTIL